MKFILSLSFVFFSSLLLAQSPATISLHVLDEVVNEDLPLATVTLITARDSQLVAGTLTNSTGRASLSGISSGDYLLIVSYVGYESQSKAVLVGTLNEYYDLGKVMMPPGENLLEEVLIESAGSTVATTMDKKSFAIDDNISQAGGSVMDAMRSLPGVTVDSEGKVMLRGSDKVAVLIDGQQSSLTGFGNQKGLENIPVANIERIEIINNPSAKYDAAGQAGVINIIYKQQKQEGLSGEVGFTYGIGELTQRKQDLPSDLGHYSLNPKYIPSLSLNYSKGKVRAFVQGQILNQRKLPNNEFTTRTYDDGRVIASQVPENRKQTQYILKGGLDFLINEHNTLSLSALYDVESHVDTAQVPFINLTSDVKTRYWHWSEHESTGFLNYRADFKHQFQQPGHSLNTSLQYTRGFEDETYFLTDSSDILRYAAECTNTDIIAIEHTSVWLLNYVKPLPSGRLEAGTKLQIRRIPVTYDIGRGENSVIYPELGDESRWGEDIYAAYLNYIWEKPKYEVEAGMRAEQTNVFYTLDPANIYYKNNDAYDYFQLYPNVRFTFKLNEKNGFSVFYNRRVDRPGEAELRVFPKYDDPELLKVGNPYLRPQFTQTSEIAYRRSWTSGSIF
ncbi:MAG: outer membrane beta-barrel protein, partial [Bacteroidia bacterium]|nr:outer membrane beta-barrel protein [Bacteroidia bacterium]